jgi:RNA polymerase sigma-70 factor (ECF subfamily)
MSRGLSGVHVMELVVDEGGQDAELAALAGEARAGNARAFDTLARRVYDRVRKWAHVISNDHDEADDVAQLVLLRLHERIEQFEGRSRFTTWLYRITRNVAYSRAHRANRRAETLARRMPEIANDQVREPEHDAREGLESLVQFCVADLPRRQREVFELCDLRGLNSTEAAAKLGITPSTARGILMKARRRIRLRMLESNPRLLEDYRP